MQQLFQELPDLKVDKLQKRPDCESYKSPNFLKRSQNDGFWHYMLKIFMKTRSYTLEKSLQFDMWVVRDG